MDPYLEHELDGRMIIDIGDFADRFIPARGSEEGRLLDVVVEKIDDDWGGIGAHRGGVIRRIYRG